MDNKTAIISNIQGYSIHDGPGIRTVVFFMGCPLRCKWCANPEGLTRAVQVGFLEKLCQNCGRCMKACEFDAIIPGEGVYRINRDKCTACGKCVDACYYGALVKYGKEMTLEEVFDSVRKDKMFYDSSGGGITVSGGEPLLNADFIAELFSLCKKENISTCIETCGDVPVDSFKKVLDVTDLFLFDIKHLNSEKHKEYTGVSNDRILDNARFLDENSASVLFRNPLIPGFNDDIENVKNTAEFIKSLNNTYEIQLMPYHRAGKSKYDALQMTYGADHIEIMSENELRNIKKQYNDLGIECSISK